MHSINSTGNARQGRCSNNGPQPDSELTSTGWMLMTTRNSLNSAIKSINSQTLGCDRQSPPAFDSTNPNNTLIWNWIQVGRQRGSTVGLYLEIFLWFILCWCWCCCLRFLFPAIEKTAAEKKVEETTTTTTTTAAAAAARIRVSRPCPTFGIFLSERFQLAIMEHSAVNIAMNPSAGDPSKRHSTPMDSDSSAGIGGREADSRWPPSPVFSDALRRLPRVQWISDSNSKIPSRVDSISFLYLSPPFLSLLVSRYYYH